MAGLSHMCDSGWHSLQTQCRTRQHHRTRDIDRGDEHTDHFDGSYRVDISDH